MTITIFPASNGDSFLIETENNNNILIDGGYINTYRDFIKPKLLELRDHKKILNHLVITHIDSDHISGIVKFVEENKNNEIIEIGTVWHNSYSNLEQIEDGLIFSGKSLDQFTVNYKLKDEQEPKEKNISAIQGSTLASLLRKFNHKSIVAYFDNKHISIDVKNSILINDVTFKLLSPNDQKLLELKKYWKRELYKNGFSSDENLKDFCEDTFELLLSQEKERKRLLKKDIGNSSAFSVDALVKSNFIEDNTVTNGSSIAFVIEESEYKVLFLGDSHPQLILENILEHYRGEQFPIKFDCIKISHHGSKSNTCPELLQYIDSENYIFSTNGSGHNHPDEETIARIINRKATFTRNLYFNYELQSLANFKDDTLQKNYDYCIIENKTNTPTIIRLKK